MKNQLVERGYLTQSLGNASHSGEHGFKAVPGLLKLVLENRAWEKRIIVETGEEFEGFNSLEEYIHANPPKGLGADKELIESLIGKDTKLLCDFDEELKKAHPHGGDRKSKEVRGNIKPDIVRLDISYGNTQEYALQKLRDAKRHDLLARIEMGELSAHAAMIEAGFRKRSLTVSDDAKGAASLIAKASPEFLEELKKLLDVKQ